jgi:hypothetical protein
MYGVKQPDEDTRLRINQMVFVMRYRRMLSIFRRTPFLQRLSNSRTIQNSPPLRIYVMTCLSTVSGRNGTELGMVYSEAFHHPVIAYLMCRPLLMWHFAFGYNYFDPSTVFFKTYAQEEEANFAMEALSCFACMTPSSEKSINAERHSSLSPPSIEK